MTPPDNANKAMTPEQALRSLLVSTNPDRVEAAYQNVKKFIQAADGLANVLELWTCDGSLQTFEDRERFRVSALHALAAYRAARGDGKEKTG